MKQGNLWDIRSSVVARWNAGQQGDQAILYGRHIIHSKIHLIRPSCPLLCITSQVQNHGLKNTNHMEIYFDLTYFSLPLLEF